MKLIKMFGLAVVAATALMAFAGVGTASATLCKVNEKPCAAGNQYPAHTTLLAVSTSAVLSGNLSVTCESHVTLLHEGIKSGKLFGKVTLLDWTNCKGCSPVTTTALPTFEDEATGGGNGLITFGTTLVELKNCLGFATCKAEATGAKLTLTGGAVGTANAKATNVPVKISGFGCGTTGTWNATYTLTAINGSKSGSVFLV
jgi:hypothetical protein